MATAIIASGEDLPKSLQRPFFVVVVVVKFFFFFLTANFCFFG
jgi:hypothetical protein